ncbi:tRNA pseudouridine(55) synthase TruB [Parapusillimonas granuli]|uniref:tRNA pseudouridine synthase B n=1 Tax=Parapusillimonas granuli TaxID=380911 RepID=A0A853GAM0_9BURK|nr:tRNA pseudouridine(55) synthase TruB [Parapusillimonas granuli]MBB5216832.1 tRNA pseudouridine55 synthase [Parapusillimonas granuli]NYT51631.1 tRNA pseudouridine(55) synthase TruB [Parapusillimonas granuli]
MASRRGQMLDGVLLLDKPEGLSSNHALQRAKRALDARKAGHTGTLDPFATGLLVCCLGKATKISGQMLDADKGYVATIRFGEETDSGDLTGNLVSSAPEGFDGVDRAELERVLLNFKGEIQQVPPMYSALKRDGKPLYEYARQGLELDRPPRTVTIHHIELLSCDRFEAVIAVQCSKGTYIRTLAQDIGRQLGCGAHLKALRRTRVGPFGLDAAVGLEALQAMPDPKAALIALDALPAGLNPATSTQKDLKL